LKIVWRPGAANDLETILQRRRAYSDASAERLGSAIKRHVSLLEDHAYLGRAVPEVEVEQIREIVESGFRIWYEVRTDSIEIFAVVHSRQDFRELANWNDPEN